MIFLILFIIFLASATFYFLSWKRTQNCKYKLPKGPAGLPFIGNVLQIVKDPHIKCSNWTKSYGNLYTIYLGPMPALVISEASLMKELFSTFASTAKFQSDSARLISLGPYGLINTEGKESQNERQFFLKAMRNFGFGKGSLEPLILDEAEQLCEWIKLEMSKNGKVVLNSILQKATINALWTIISGKRVSFDDSQVPDLLHAFTTAMQYTMRTGLGFLPWLKHLAPNLSGYTAYFKACSDMHEFVKEKFTEHKKSMVMGSPRDLLDIYNERLETAEDGEKKLTWKNNVASVVHLFVGGGESTANSLNWLIFSMVQNLGVQKKMHGEIDRVIGNREPTLADRASMPYIEAVILETLRHHTTAVLGIPHRLLEDLKFKEYNLPKGLILFASIYHCHKDPNVWEKPDTFLPERLLDNDGNVKEEQRKNLVPFQAGRRQCIGDNLAKDVMFLFVTKIFQKFTVYPDPTVELEKYSEPNVGILVLPLALGIIMVPRCQKKNCNIKLAFTR